MLSLRAYLDSGAPLDLLPEFQRLAEAVVIDRREHSRDWLFDAACGCRRLASSLLSDPLHEDLARVLEWAAEAYEDEDLARRFEEALPCGVLGEILASAEEPPHPHRLLVTMASFSCSACSDEYVESLGISVQAVEGITYCRHCIRIAARAVSDIGAVPDDAGDLVAAAKKSGPPRRRLGTIAATVALVAVFLTGSAGVASGRLLPEPLEDIIQRTLGRFGVIEPRSEPSGCPPPVAAKGTRCSNVDRQSAGARTDHRRPGYFEATSRNDEERRDGYDGEYPTAALGMSPNESQSGQKVPAEGKTASAGAGSWGAAPAHFGGTVEQQPQQPQGGRRSSGDGVAPPVASPPKRDIPDASPPSPEPPAQSPPTDDSAPPEAPSIPNSSTPKVPNQSPPSDLDPPAPESTPEAATTPVAGKADQGAALAEVNL